MTASLRSLVIATSQIKDVLRFYQNLGLEFKTKKVALGTEYYWTLANGLEIAFLEKPDIKLEAQPHYLLSFRVKEIDKKYQQFVANKFIGIMDPTDFDEGRKAIVLDPDGRSVEMLEG
ncbi:MAG: VOC family protein [Bdellovibrionaceae bacterium]|nr:VOC family protein [Pseudobdellovibrionaceae bacterium]